MADDSKIRDRPVDPDEALLRGQTVEMFARLESTLDAVIQHYYTPGHPISTYLWLDVLRAEGFSYGLRREIFETIVRRHGWYDATRMQHLHRAARWRNFLAHVAGVEMHDYGNDAEVPKVGYRDPRHPHPTLSVAEAFDQFKREWDKAEDYASEINAKVGRFPDPSEWPPRDDPGPRTSFVEAWDRQEVERLNAPK